MQASEEEKLNPGHDFNSETELSQDFNSHLKITTNLQENVKTEQNGETEHLGYDDDCDDVEDEDEEEDEFSFFCGETNTSPIAAEDAFVNGQIKPVFPLFDRDLQFSGDGSISLPMRPPVKKVFVETTEGINGGMTSSSAGDDEIVGPYCEWSSRKAVEASPAAAEVCKKSNSTGFSKIWRFREFVGRCNSDGRDAFVFLNNAPPRAAAPAPAVEKQSEKTESTAKVNRKAKRSAKTTPLSAHEAYMRSKAKEEERRRSYLPYRPELMGFFTNVNGGLTKNVHPF